MITFTMLTISCRQLLQRDNNIDFCYRLIQQQEEKFNVQMFLDIIRAIFIVFFNYKAGAKGEFETFKHFSWFKELGLILALYHYPAPNISQKIYTQFCFFYFFYHQFSSKSKLGIVISASILIHCYSMFYKVVMLYICIYYTHTL